MEEQTLKRFILAVMVFLVGIGVGYYWHMMAIVGQ